MQFLTTITNDPYVGETAQSLAVMEVVAVVVLAVFAATLVQCALGAWALGKVFQKAGVSAWKAWVPIYNYIVLLMTGRLSPWLILLHLVPGALALAAMPGLATGAIGDYGFSIIHALAVTTSFLAYVPLIIAVHRINDRLGKGAGFTVLCFFLPFVWALIIGLGNSRWTVPPKATI